MRRAQLDGKAGFLAASFRALGFTEIFVKGFFLFFCVCVCVFFFFFLGGGWGFWGFRSLGFSSPGFRLGCRVSWFRAIGFRRPVRLYIFIGFKDGNTTEASVRR